MKVDRHSQIYKEYVEKQKGVTVQEIADKYGITKAGVYHIVHKIERGEVAKLQKCTELSKQACLWQYKYQKRYELLPKNRKPETVKLLKHLISDMRKDKFKIGVIATYLNKDRTTIIHHIK